MRKSILATILIASLVTVSYVIRFTHPQSVLALTSYFSDEFDGTTIDANKWNLSIATSGVRYEAPNTDITQPGSWILPPDPAPYGSLILDNGLMTFTHNAEHVVPYVWRGPPSYPSPFPSSGDFSFEVRMRYDVLNGQGVGLQIRNWGNSEPVGDNNPFLVPFGSGVNYMIWGDLDGLRYEIHTAGFNQTYILTSGENDFHTYRLDYINGIYISYVDGIQVGSAIQSSLRPDTIWFGNPVYTSGTNWSSFTIDYIRVVFANAVPVADAGLDQTVVVNDLVILDGSGSSDADLHSLTYSWSEDVGNPQTGILTGSDTVDPSFTPTVAGVYKFTLVVNDGYENSTPDEAEVTVSGIGSFLVVDTKDRLVYKYSLDGTPEGSFSLVSANTSPRGIAMAGSLVLVVDRDGRKVYKYALDGTPQGSFDLAAANVNSGGIEVVSETVLVADKGTNSIFKYSLDGTPQGSFNLASGNGDAQGLGTDGNNLAVVDDDDNRVYLYDLTGTPQGTFNLTSGNGDPEGVTSDGTSYWVVDEEDRKVYRYNTSGVFLDSFLLLSANADSEGITLTFPTY